MRIFYADRSSIATAFEGCNEASRVWRSSYNYGSSFPILHPRSKPLFSRASFAIGEETRVKSIPPYLTDMQPAAVARQYRDGSSCRTCLKL